MEEGLSDAGRLHLLRSLSPVELQPTKTFLFTPLLVTHHAPSSGFHFAMDAVPASLPHPCSAPSALPSPLFHSPGLIPAACGPPQVSGLEPKSWSGPEALGRGLTWVFSGSGHVLPKTSICPSLSAPHPAALPQQATSHW